MLIYFGLLHFSQLGCFIFCSHFSPLSCWFVVVVVGEPNSFSEYIFSLRYSHKILYPCQPIFMFISQKKTMQFTLVAHTISKIIIRLRNNFTHTHIQTLTHIIYIWIMDGDCRYTRFRCMQPQICLIQQRKFELNAQPFSSWEWCIFVCMKQFIGWTFTVNLHITQFNYLPLLVEFSGFGMW